MTQFLLNNAVVDPTEPDGRLLLDYVRSIYLTGTKEGCKEGDCGACTVLIGETDANGEIVYEPVTSCLVPLVEMSGRHVVTIEGLNLTALTPVQQSMVKFGGTQCGYCTPGFIVSITWLLLAPEFPDLDGFKRAISGNLCRCTGYSSILRAGEELIDKLEPFKETWNEPGRVRKLVGAGYLPPSFESAPTKLGELTAEPLQSVDGKLFIAGGTDLYVQQGEHIPQQSIVALNRYPELKGYRVDGNALRLGSLTTFEAFAAIPEVRTMIPKIDDFMFLIASLQIRNRATLSGNIINASPIGDMTQMLLALGSTLHFKNGDEKRCVEIEDLFLGYKQLDKAPNDIMTEIAISLGGENTFVNFEKVSKRKALDIATVCSGARFEIENDRIMQARVSMGGVSAIPLLLRDTNRFLTGKSLTSETVLGAFPILQAEIAPISDVRGSADYKRLLAQQLFTAHFLECFPDKIQFEDVARVG